LNFRHLLLPIWLALLSVGQTSMSAEKTKVQGHKETCPNCCRPE